MVLVGNSGDEHAQNQQAGRVRQQRQQQQAAIVRHRENYDRRGSIFFQPAAIQPSGQPGKRIVKALAAARTELQRLPATVRVHRRPFVFPPSQEHAALARTGMQAGRRLFQQRFQQTVAQGQHADLDQQLLLPSAQERAATAVDQERRRVVTEFPRKGHC